MTILILTTYIDNENREKKHQLSLVKILSFTMCNNRLIYLKVMLKEISNIEVLFFIILYNGTKMKRGKRYV